MALSKGVIQSHLEKGVLPPEDRSVFRVLGIKAVEDRSNPGSAATTKFRLAVTDGEARFNYAMLIAPSPEEAPKWLPAKGDTIDLNNSLNEMRTIQGKHLLLVHRFKTITEHNRSTPGTPSTSSREGTGEPPKPPMKRPPVHNESSSQESPAGPSSSAATQAKRALFKAASAPAASIGPKSKTHSVADLNPYQNKFTICVRVATKEPIKSVSNSRWSGEIFSVVLRDDTGDIKATAFSEFARKFAPVMEEGKSYYISNAQVKSVTNRAFNTTGHNYELTFNQTTEVGPCRSTVQAPKPRFNFIALSEVANKGDKETVEVLGVVTDVKDVFEGTSRAGKPYKKRECVLVDDDRCEVPLTVWGDKADSLGDADHKVVAVKGAYVSEWNGVKGINLGFNASLSIEPDIDEAKYLKTFFDGNYSGGWRRQIVNAHTYGTNAVSSTLGEIKLDAAQWSVDDVAKFYSLDVYFTHILLGNASLAYKACREENCRRKVHETATGGAYFCKKCQRTSPSYDWRYMLRGSFADMTGAQWFTAFGDSATQLIGASAVEMMTLLERSPREFEKRIQAVKYRRLRVKLRCKNEMYDGEKRLKLTLQTAEKVDGSTEEYQVKMRAAIDQMKAELGVA